MGLFHPIKQTNQTKQTNGHEKWEKKNKNHNHSALCELLYRKVTTMETLLIIALVNRYWLNVVHLRAPQTTKFIHFTFVCFLFLIFCWMQSLVTPQNAEHIAPFDKAKINFGREKWNNKRTNWPPINLGHCIVYIRTCDSIHTCTMCCVCEYMGATSIYACVIGFQMQIALHTYTNTTATTTTQLYLFFVVFVVVVDAIHLLSFSMKANRSKVNNSYMHGSVLRCVYMDILWRHRRTRLINQPA